MFISVIGATPNKRKYGYKVLKDLMEKGIGDVVPVNPNYSEIEGIKCYKSITHVPYDIDMVVFIVPPSVGLKVLEEVVDKGIKNVWFQPGAESEEIERFCKDHKLNYSFYRCILISDKKEIRDFPVR